MDNNIEIIDENGIKQEVEVLDIFNVSSYDNKEYILYTKNREIDENNIEVFVSILEQNNDNYKLVTIEDEQEWEAVQRAIDEMGDLS